MIGRKRKTSTYWKGSPSSQRCSANALAAASRAKRRRPSDVDLSSIKCSTIARDLQKVLVRHFNAAQGRQTFQCVNVLPALCEPQHFSPQPFCLMRSGPLATDSERCLHTKTLALLPVDECTGASSPTSTKPSA